MTLSLKLIVSYVVVIAILLLSSTVSYILGKAHENAVTLADVRKQEISQIWELKYLSLRQYQIQADYVINRDEKSIKDMSEAEGQRAELGKKIDEVCDTDEEKSAIADYHMADKAFDELFQKELVPAVQGNADMKVLAAIDNRTDGLVSQMRDALDIISKSIQTEVDASVKKQEQMESFSNTFTIVMAAVALLMTVLMAILLIRSIVGQVNRMVATMAKVAAGDMRERVIADEARANKRDELTKISLAFDHLVGALAHVIKRVADSANSVASSSEELAASSEETGRAVQQVTQTIQEVARGAQDTMRNIGGAQQNITQTAKAIEGVSRDIEEVAAYAVEAATQGNAGKKCADDAVSIINHAADSVQKTATVVQSLGEKTRQIGEFIGIITAIADQTNLLALNAAIEAARAGEAGRGFAVVAEEVRKLAEESNGAAGNITKLVKAIETEMESAIGAMEKSSGEVTNGADTVAQASQMLSEIVKGVEALTERVQGISAAAEQINASTGEVVHSMQTVAAVAEENAAATEQVSASTEEQSSAMEEVASTAGALSSLAQELQVMVGQFKV